MKSPPNPYEYNHYYDAPDGKRYLWDPDFQQWMHVMTVEEYQSLSHWEKYDWLYWSIAILILSIYFAL